MSQATYPTLPGLAYGVNMSPRWSTSIQTAITGRETRIALMQYPLWDIDLVYEFIRSSAVYPELQTLVNFFNQAQGAWDSWYWNNPDDNTVTAQNIGTGTGAQTTFYFARSFGGFSEPVWWPTSAQVYVAGVLKTFGTDYTIPTAGQILFTTAPASGAAITWTGTFVYRCRFKDDTTQFSKFMSQLWEAKKVSFVANLQGRLGTT